MKIFNLRNLLNKLFSSKTIYIKLPIAAFLAVCINLYFLFPPKLIYLEENTKAPKTIVKVIKKDRILFKYDIDLYFKNNSFRKGYIDKYEVFPQGIPKTDYRIISSSLERKRIKWKQTERIPFSITIEQNRLYTEKENPYILETEPLVIRFFDGDGSNIIDKKGNIAYLIIGVQLSSNPFN